ncbi:hypothetical protein [Gluconobacter kondonii]|uniref:hypothetical protein n=1 Tax=Gluconobacter kondonii TaxID=941463 RepID=UPI0019817B8F|nr:hypothetical protein [Gluconobacter kondonii]MBN3868006.1 hypothetical protein [Gluconobacter kondonii]
MTHQHNEQQVIIESLRAISETQQLHGRMLVALVHALDLPGDGEGELTAVLRELSGTLRNQRHSVDTLNEQLKILPAQLAQTLEAELSRVLNDGL